MGAPGQEMGGAKSSRPSTLSSAIGRFILGTQHTHSYMTGLLLVYWVYKTLSSMSECVIYVHAVL